MNIIGGKKRGSKLVECTSKAVRPTAQRTRDALFNILNGGRFSFSLSGATVIDLFAGTGAIGLEALSRGAASCVFIEKDGDALQTLQANISKLELGYCAHILANDARLINSWARPRADLVFADPPYDSNLAGEGLNQLVTADAISQKALIVIETRKTDNCQLGPEFVLAYSRVYGISRLNFFTRADD